MNRAVWARALRLPLLAALAVNLGAVAVTPLYWARTAPLPPPPTTTAGEFDSLPVSSEAPGQSGDEPTTEIAGPEPVTVAVSPADSARPMDTPVVSPDATSDAATDHSDNVAPANRQLTISAETLSDVGRSLRQVNDPAHSLGRSVAHVAGRATRWLNAIADSAELAEPASNVNANVSDRSPDDNGSALPHPADTARDGRDARSIVISNASGANLPVAFLVDEQAQSLAPGKRLEIPASQATVRFDRGHSFGEATRTLAPGVYRFVVTDRGWDLLGPDTANAPVSPTSPR